jgi:hypothetical protein
MEITIENNNWVKLKYDEEGDLILTFIDGNFDSINIGFRKGSRHLKELIEDLNKIKYKEENDN